MYTMMQDELRTINYEYNGMPPGTYVCFDDLKDLKQRGNEHCNHIGLWKSGSGAMIDAISFYLSLEDPESGYEPKSLEWSDELALSAALYTQELQGCSLWQPNLQEDIDVHEFLVQNNIEFEDHLRIVVYPE